MLMSKHLLLMCITCLQFPLSVPLHTFAGGFDYYGLNGFAGTGFTTLTDSGEGGTGGLSNTVASAGSRALLSDPPEICLLPPETGPCRASIVRYFHNASSNACEDFIYGGCKGNANNFKTKEECERTCLGGQSGSNDGKGEENVSARSQERDTVPSPNGKASFDQNPQPPADTPMPPQEPEGDKERPPPKDTDPEGKDKEQEDKTAAPSPDSEGSAGGPEDSEQEGDGDRSKDNNSKSGAVAARASGVLITLASIIWMFPGF